MFLDKATCHPESMIDSLSQVKIIFLPKNTTSRLQPLDAGVIQNFKVMYRKRLVKYELAIINENFSATRIIKDVNVLMVIQWAQEAWKEKGGVDKSNDDLMGVVEDDLASEVLVREFSFSLYA